MHECVPFLALVYYNYHKVKIKFPPICPVDMKSDILIIDCMFTNPVEDRVKCRMCMTFGSILYRIGGEQSMKCQISCRQDSGLFHFSPCEIVRH